MANQFTAPLPHDPQATYTLVRQFNSVNLQQMVSPNTFSPYQFTTIRMKSASYPLRPLPVCEGMWRFFPFDTHSAFTSFYNSVINTTTPDPAASIRGIFVLTPSVLWNARMEAMLEMKLPTIYLYAGVEMTGEWLTQQSALVRQFPALVQGPTLFDYYQGNYTAGEYPFSTFEIAGKFGWRADKNSLYASDDDVYRPDSPVPLEHDDRNALFLVDTDLQDQKSGAVRIKVAPGWAVEIALTTGNNGYFDILNGLAGVDVGSATTNYIRGSANYVTFTLLDGDELQIGIDANEHPTIAPTNFSLHLASQKWAIPVIAPKGWVASTAAVDDECWVELLSVRRTGTGGPAPMPVAPNMVYRSTSVDGQIRLEPIDGTLTLDQWKKLEILRGQIAVPSHQGLSLALPPLTSTSPGEGELTIQCGVQLEHQQEGGRYAPAPFAPMPLESIYQRAFDLGLQDDLIDGGNSHPVVQLITHSMTARNAGIKFAELEYFPEPDSDWVGGMKFDTCYPSGVVSSEWDGYFMRWQSPYDGTWRRSVVSRNGTTYVEVKPGTPTVVSMFKRSVTCRYVIDSPPDDKVPIQLKPFLVGYNDLPGTSLSYTCVIQVPTVMNNPTAPNVPMFYDPRVIEDWIDKHLIHYNSSIIGRTGWLLSYSESHPEIAWARFEHVLSRNHGFLMLHINRSQAFLNLLSGLLADWMILFAALLAAGLIGTVGVILVLLLTIVTMVVRGLDYQASTQGSMSRSFRSSTTFPGGGLFPQIHSIKDDVEPTWDQLLFALD